jgi:transposase
LAKGYGIYTIRRAKTDKIDSLKIARLCLDKWVYLERYTPVSESREALKIYNRQLNEYSKIQTMLKNNLIALLDQAFPSVNKLFSGKARESDGHDKWIDFVIGFWHSECISSLTAKEFTLRYQKWCHKSGYCFSTKKADEIYLHATEVYVTLPKNDFTKTLITQAAEQLNHISEAVYTLKTQMHQTASQLPEYATVMAMHGVGYSLGPQLMAEIGDIRRYPKRTSLVRFAGIEPPECQSGTYNRRSRRISKQGSPHLRRALFLVMVSVLENKHTDEPMFQFLDRKRAEGKPYKVYYMAGANKFLRIYYARVMEYMKAMDPRSSDLCAAE